MHLLPCICMQPLHGRREREISVVPFDQLFMSFRFVRVGSVHDVNLRCRFHPAPGLRPDDDTQAGGVLMMMVPPPETPPVGEKP